MLKSQSYIPYRSKVRDFALIIYTSEKLKLSVGSETVVQVYNEKKKIKKFEKETR